VIKVHIMFHKDGDHLVIMKEPWWSDIYEWILNRFCPCCGVSGRLCEKLPEWLSDKYFNVWNKFLWLPIKLEKELYKVPVEAGCVAYRAIYGDDFTCWRDDCPHCWHQGDDAYTWKS